MYVPRGGFPMSSWDGEKVKLKKMSKLKNE